MTRSQLTCPSLATVCTPMRKPGVGTVHLHRRRWRPGRLSSVIFENVHGGRHAVDLGAVEELLQCGSLLEAMAVIRPGSSVAASGRSRSRDAGREPA